MWYKIFVFFKLTMHKFKEMDKFPQQKVRK